MKIKSAYQMRPVRFLEIYPCEDWYIKIYSISIKSEKVSAQNLQKCKNEILKWLKNSEFYDLETYKIATLIIHEGREGCFAIINWWIDENMLQNFVYMLKENTNDFQPFSHKGIITCVWEMAVLWHERNAWVKHILMQNENPDITSYLNEQLNENI